MTERQRIGSALARRRAVLRIPLAWGIGALVPGAARSAPPQGLPLASSLADELAAALRAGQPLVVMVSLDGCPFCRLVRDSYLVPLRRENGQPVVQVDMRSSVALRDFAGRAVTHDSLVSALRVSIAPTLLFVGPGAKEVAPRLEGVGAPDFYGAYLDDRLRAARRALG